MFGAGPGSLERTTRYQESFVFDGRFRQGVERGLGPVGSALRHLGVNADHVTAAGLAVSVATGLAVAAGWLIVGLFLLILSGALDLHTALSQLQTVMVQLVDQAIAQARLRI